MRGKALLWLLGGLGAALLALAAGGLLLDIPASTGEARILRVNVLIGLLMLSASIYFAAVRLVLRHAWPRGTVWVVVGVAVSLRALMLAAPPILSTDIYRYVWDGRVQAADINPYRYIPADPALATLRDTVIYPQINRADYARTIYPPVAQMVFAAVGRIWDSVMGMRLAMLGIEALGIVCLLRLLPLAGLPRERILIYVWNPLAVWSFANDGHVDAIAVGLLGLALLLRARHKDGWAGAALAGAVLAKFFPLVVAPALLRGARFWRPTLAGLAVIVGCYDLYIGAGWHVLGFLRSYGQDEGITSGHGIWLLAGLATGEAPTGRHAGLRRLCRYRLPRCCRGDPPATRAHERRTGTVSRHRAVGRRRDGCHQPALPLVFRLARTAGCSRTLPCPALARDHTSSAHWGACPRGPFLLAPLVYVPAILLLPADLRPRLAIKLRRGAEIGDTLCPPRLA
jgi:Glycosyltransferase family 87